MVTSTYLSLSYTYLVFPFLKFPPLTCPFSFSNSLIFHCLIPRLASLFLHFIPLFCSVFISKAKLNSYDILSFAFLLFILYIHIIHPLISSTSSFILIYLNLHHPFIPHLPSSTCLLPSFHALVVFLRVLCVTLSPFPSWLPSTETKSVNS